MGNKACSFNDHLSASMSTSEAGRERYCFGKMNVYSCESLLMKIKHFAGLFFGQSIDTYDVVGNLIRESEL